MVQAIAPNSLLGRSLHHYPETSELNQRQAKVNSRPNTPMLENRDFKETLSFLPI
ncbi:hypothetical protein I79_020577 [Cricetulus griseus]|uniref:Uncharacterized protein n=1 Tax=Cricetulus griseus TaxID=10029 RepID=G3IAF6_CRIGR|nr:hypothetical protein I79_020577 [Cricetulus griseus]